MANALPRLKQQAIIHLLVEGNSIRSVERLTGVHRDTIMRLAVNVGGKCKKFLNAWLRNLKLRHVQADEIWTFVGCKQEKLKRALVINPTMGDQFLYVAFDQDTKLIASYAIGKRCTEVTQAFMYDLADRIVTDAPQLSTDGWQAYPNAVKNAFVDEIAYGQIIKEFAEPIQPGRYGPPVLVASERRQITGLTDIDLKSICTSHVERNNLTIRTFLRRFTRLSLGFSKKLENHRHACALYFMHYNFCRIHQTLRVTPAMEAGITDHVWDIAEIVRLLR